MAKEVEKKLKRSDITDEDVVIAVNNYWECQQLGKYPYEQLAEKFNCDEKLAYSACERAYGNGLIEYGVSLRTGWLTDAGKKLFLTTLN